MPDPQEEWLPGWRITKIPSCRKPYDHYPEECEWMIKIGYDLYNLDSRVLPNLRNAKLPAIHLNGTGGNFAVRVPGISGSVAFVGTPRGGHKGNLGQDDFVIVHCVDETRREIYYSCSGNRQPSTDTLPVWRAFYANPAVNVWVHFHFPLYYTSLAVEMPYPATEEAHWRVFEQYVRRGAAIVNLINHTGESPGKPDACVILGPDTRGVARKTIILVRQALGFAPGG